MQKKIAAPALWLAWLLIFALTTVPAFLWQLNYFKSPGPRFYTIALVFVPLLAIVSWTYAALRRSWLWKYELLALTTLPVLALFYYEPRAALVVAALFLACCTAGNFAMRKLGLTLAIPLDRITVGFGAGCGILITILFVLGLLRWLYPGVFLALLLVPIVVCWRDAWQAILDLGSLHRRWRESTELRHPITGIAIAFGFVTTVCALMPMLAPSIIIDPLYLHLPSVQYYAASHALLPVPGIDYSYYPQGIELIWTLAYSLAGQPGSQMVSAVFFSLFLAMLFRLGRECGMDRAAAAAGVIVAATLPFLHWAGSVMKDDLAMALFQAIAIYAFIRWLAGRDFRWILAGTFFLAQSCGVKHIALFGAVPLALMYLYAAWRQRNRWKAAAAVALVFAVFGTYWLARAWLLTGNPLYPETARRAVSDAVAGSRAPFLVKAEEYAKLPWKMFFQGQDAFESPLNNPAGIVLFVFLPLVFLSVLVGQVGNLRRVANPPQSAGYQPAHRISSCPTSVCILFTATYLLYWALTIAKLRYATLPFALLALLVTACAKRFYDGAGSLVKMTLAAFETYCLLFATMGIMIIEVNAPQFAYFARRIDKPGYLRAALQNYASIEYLQRTGEKPVSVFAVENFSRAYAPDPLHFQSMWCSEGCVADKVVNKVKLSGARYLILPAQIPPAVLEQLGKPEPLYRDPNFMVFRIGRE